jgi:hypothetical protein
MLYRVIDGTKESFYRDGVTDGHRVLHNGKSIYKDLPQPYRYADGKLLCGDEMVADVTGISRDPQSSIFYYIDIFDDLYIARSPSIRCKVLSDVIDVNWRWPNIFDFNRGTHIVVFSDGRAQFGKFTEDHFEHIPSATEDMINSVGPLRCVRGVFQNLSPDRYQVVNEKNELWAGRTEMHQLPGSATWLIEAFMYMSPVSWSLGIHSKLSKTARATYRMLLLTCIAKKVHFVLYLQVAELM